jgi:hypothetical protein
MECLLQFSPEFFLSCLVYKSTKSVMQTRIIFHIVLHENLTCSFILIEMYKLWMFDNRVLARYARLPCILPPE